MSPSKHHPRINNGPSLPICVIALELDIEQIFFFFAPAARGKGGAGLLLLGGSWWGRTVQ